MQRSLLTWASLMSFRLTTKQGKKEGGMDGREEGGMDMNYNTDYA